MKLQPCVVFASGIAGTGKTTTFKRLADIVDNAVFLARDTAAQQILTVDPQAGLPGKFPEGLQPFDVYVEKDSIKGNSFSIQTPFGLALQIGQRTAYNARHGINQCDLSIYAIAKDNLENGKVALIDSLTARRFKAGEVEKIVHSDFFRGFDTDIIFFYFSDRELMRQRILERAESDAFAKSRVEYSKAQDKGAFDEYVEKSEKDFTQNFGKLDIHRLDVFGKSPDQCAQEITDYLAR